MENKGEIEEEEKDCVCALLDHIDELYIVGQAYRVHRLALLVPCHAYCSVQLLHFSLPYTSTEGVSER